MERAVGDQGNRKAENNLSDSQHVQPSSGKKGQ